MSKLKAIHIDLSVAVTALLVGWCMQTWLQIDACRDNGDAWNYELNNCQGGKGG
jgi:hypothetical protein